MSKHLHTHLTWDIGPGHLFSTQLPLERRRPDSLFIYKSLWAATRHGHRHRAQMSSGNCRRGKGKAKSEKWPGFCTDCPLDEGHFNGMSTILPCSQPYKCRLNLWGIFSLRAVACMRNCFPDNSIWKYLSHSNEKLSGHFWYSFSGN